MLKFLKKYGIILAVIIVGIFFLRKINILPSFKDIFKSQPVLIDESPIILQQINTLAQLITITYSDEIVMDTVKIRNGLPTLLPTNVGALLVPAIDKLVIIGRGKVLAGTDLKSIHPEDIYATKDSVHLFLPKATILQTIINPSGFETFEEKGTWTEAEITGLKISIRNEINRRAIQQNILVQANERSKNILETFLRNTGFSKVVIEWKN